MKYLVRFNENINKNLSESDVRNLLVELFDTGFDVNIKSTIGLVKTSGKISKNIDMAEFLDNILSFITKMNYSGFIMTRNEVHVGPLDGKQFNSFNLEFRMKDWIRTPSDVIDSDTFEDYISNIGFEYSENYSEVNLFELGELYVVIENDYFTMEIDMRRWWKVRDSDKPNLSKEDMSFLLNNLSTEESEIKYNYNIKSIEILEKIIEIIK
jgi:hypothetical protein